ncbi:MAG: hypothetical protein DRG40_03615 [Deltaproteobacteria bacterium]|nr:MAG: hypothetical protein DRG40_03615 [Deltaproteobacteria bacterium]
MEVRRSTQKLQKLKEFFDWATRRSFWDLNIRNRKVIEYISDLLTFFASTENLYRIRNQKGERLFTLVEMLLEANEVALKGGSILREREIRKHVGDYVLFMTGMFREYVNRLSLTSYYLHEGARAYWSVSQIDHALFRPGADLFQELSSRFEFYVGALNYMRTLFFRDREGKDPESFHSALYRII